MPALSDIILELLKEFRLFCQSITKMLRKRYKNITDGVELVTCPSSVGLNGGYHDKNHRTSLCFDQH